ncbi:MAG TPA: molybdopterin-dependent oxidoreductase [Candidatus Aquicultor sp.]|jgi:anaerobic selenocysteine-containing dehydrogenase
MTNHWIDIKNSKLIMVLGANPVENHPVVTQYINEAIGNGAKMIVVDPRRTRTAAMAQATGGMHLRIRPGTNGALMMGLFNYLISNKKYDAAYQTAMASRTFTNETGTKVTKNPWPKWTDSLFRLNSDGSDYQRSGGFPVVSTQPLDNASSDSDTVFQTLKRRAAYYDAATVASVCDIPGGASAFTQFAAMVAEGHGDDSTAGGTGSAKGSLYPATILYAMGATQFTHASQDLRAYSMLQMLLGCMGRAGGGINALRGIHNVQGSTDMGVLFSSMPGYSDVPLRNETTLSAAAVAGATTVQVISKVKFHDGDTLRIDAGKATQEDVVISAVGTETMSPFTVTLTAGLVNAHVKGAAVMDTTHIIPDGWYGIYMDKLFGGARVKGAGNNYYNATFDDGSFNGWNLQQHGFRNMMHWYFRQKATPFAADRDPNNDGSILNNLNFDLLPKGNGYHHIEMFKYMDPAKATADAKTQVKCMFVLGQNPANTEPNQTLVTKGLYELDTLVVSDIFETETAGCERKPTGVTYLLPAGGFVEEEGSVTNSGRWIQWRYKAINPQGGSKSDTEILLRLAKKLEEKGAFSHIPTTRKGDDSGNFSSLYEGLYGSQYGWDPAGTTPFNDVAATVAESIFKQMAHTKINSADGNDGGWGALWIYRGGWGGWAGVGNYKTIAKNTPGNDTGATKLVDNYTSASAAAKVQSNGTTSITIGGVARTVSTVTVDALTYNITDTSGTFVMDKFLRGDTCYVDGEQATIWSIDTASSTLTLMKMLAHTPAANTDVKNVPNRAKSRGGMSVGHNGTDSTVGLYSNWGWAWLKNRRIFYNNSAGSLANDVADTFVAPDQVSRFFVHHDPQYTSPANVNYSADVITYATTYRYYSKLKDLNSGDSSTCDATKGATMPKHWECIETNNSAALTKYGKTGDAPTGAIGTTTNYPFILETIRVTEHFQGGPTTRNIPWLCELVPEPFIELNSADASAKGIKNGDSVYIDTARKANVGPFKAKVGSGLSTQQYVKQGVVAIPWHWNKVYLRNALGRPEGVISEGASANDLTIDALDMNIKMPEYKVCLCQIHK